MSTGTQSTAQATPRRTDPVIVRLNCEAEPFKDTQTIDRAEWDAMTPAERAERLDDMVQTHIGNSGGGGWHIADREDEAAVGDSPSVGRARTAIERWDSGAISDVDTLLTELRAALGLRPRANRQETKPDGEQPAPTLDLYIELIVDAVRALHQPDGIERPRLESHVTEALRRKGWTFNKTLFAQAIIKSVSHDQVEYLGGEDRGDILYRATTDPQMGDR